MENILIVDDEKSLLDLLAHVFKKEGYGVKTSLSGVRALQILEKEDIDLVVTDIKMPQLSGMDVLKPRQAKDPEIPVVMITAYGSVQLEVRGAGLCRQALRRRGTVSGAWKKSGSTQEGPQQLRKHGRQEPGHAGDLHPDREGRDHGLHGPGHGRERDGQGDGRPGHPPPELPPDGRFVSINCAALPENLLESELFGHAKGSFTGAVRKEGYVAGKGTLFLDEVGEMSPWSQVKLLRALQERTIRRVGGTEEIPIDVRIIAATNQDLKKRIEEGRFREELFYRLNVISFEMPPLRKRTEDLPILVSHFLQKHLAKTGKGAKRVAPEVISLFEAYSWPGNIRELENVIERIVAIEDRETITAGCLPRGIPFSRKKEETGFLFQPGFSLTGHVDDLTKKYITQALAVTAGNLRKASGLLGVTYRTLRYLIDKYGLKAGRHDEGSGRQHRQARGQIVPKYGTKRHKMSPYEPGRNR